MLMFNFNTRVMEPNKQNFGTVYYTKIEVLEPKMLIIERQTLIHHFV